LHVSERRARNKSLFASFSSEKEEVFFFEKKNQKTFTPGAALPEDVCVCESFSRINMLTGHMGRRIITTGLLSSHAKAKRLLFLVLSHRLVSGPSSGGAQFRRSRSLGSLASGG
jgi:hypothetical protein